MKRIKQLRAVKDYLTKQLEEVGIELNYYELKKFDTPLYFEMMKKDGVLEDYKKFMIEASEYLYGDVIEVRELSTETTSTIVIPKPSPALEAFKNRYNKYFG